MAFRNLLNSAEGVQKGAHRSVTGDTVLHALKGAYCTQSVKAFCTLPKGNLRRMENQALRTPAERLAAAREKRGYGGPADVCRALGWNVHTYKQHENGIRDLSRQAAEKYARALGVTAGWLLYGEKPKPMGEATIRMGGVIGAGQEVWPDGDYEDTESALATGAAEAFRVKGDSMLPVAREGDVLFFGRRRNPKNLIGRECIVELEDGRRFFKILRHGRKPGFYNLDSYNAPGIDDVKITAAGELLAIRRA